MSITPTKKWRWGTVKVGVFHSYLLALPRITITRISIQDRRCAANSVLLLEGSSWCGILCDFRSFRRESIRWCAAAVSFRKIHQNPRGSIEQKGLWLCDATTKGRSGQFQVIEYHNEIPLLSLCPTIKNHNILSSSSTVNNSDLLLAGFRAESVLNEMNWLSCIGIWGPS